jgi:hypothetical protein
MKKSKRGGIKRKNAKPKVVVFTGVSQLAGMGQYPYIEQVVGSLRAKVFISGGAPGVDTCAAVEAKRQFPKARHIVVKPYGYKINDVHFAWCRQQKFEVITLQKHPSREHPNLIRNQFMIDRALALAADLKTEAICVAFPGGAEEILRSGTWATVRRARAADMRVYLYPLTNATGSMIGGQIER